MERARRAVRVEGLVQGVGFRPFVHALAARLRLGGWVRNDGQGVVIEVEGARDAVEHFLIMVGRDAPPLAVVERLTVRDLACRGETAFVIAPSAEGPRRTARVSPDVATCDDCLREIFDPADRRHRYAFTTCTNCGPRFTIVLDVPYDRATTTMARFPMCVACRQEYENPADRRFHAESIACPRCGPRLVLEDATGRRHPGDPIATAAGLLRDGRIIAIKGLGGFHLAADAASETAVSTLRRRKQREDKPFAVMAPDLGAVGRLVDLSPEEERLLLSPRRPIVLLRRRPDAAISAATAPDNRCLGVMLPYTPLHHLLARTMEAPLVLTSGNVSDEPIAYRDRDARARLDRIADAFLTHDRRIHRRTDDSVVRALGGTPLVLRRARGYAPEPVALAWTLERPVLACGAELKNTICVGRGRHAFLSHHLGDLEHEDALRAFAETVVDFQRLFEVDPAVIAHDLHPEYLSTKWALDQGGVAARVGVQHHHAHVVSCLAEHGVAGPVIGVAFDGLGFGTDGTLWGGEFLIADLMGFRRVGHLSMVPMPGGTAAIRAPWRMAVMYLATAYDGAPPAVDVLRRHEREWPAVLALARHPAHAPLTSSAGRLFDAVAALLGVRDTVSYEGQAAVELEQLVDVEETGVYGVTLAPGGAGFELRGADLVRSAAEDVQAGTRREAVAARFHNGMVEAIRRGCQTVRERSGLTTVALSGGVFQNVILLDRAAARLARDGFTVLRHRQVPPNDGGISLGQAVIAGRVAAAG